MLKHLLISRVNTLFKSDSGAAYYRLLSKCYAVFYVCDVLSPLMCTQWNNTAHREAGAATVNIHIIMPIELMNISTKDGLPSTSLYKSSFQMESHLIALRSEITNFAPLSCLRIKEALCDMNARTWWCDYFNNTWEIWWTHSESGVSPVCAALSVD